MRSRSTFSACAGKSHSTVFWLGFSRARIRRGWELRKALRLLRKSNPPPVDALSRFIEAELPRLEALNEPDDAAGDVEELNGFFRRYALEE